MLALLPISPEGSVSLTDYRKGGMKFGLIDYASISSAHVYISKRS